MVIRTPGEAHMEHRWLINKLVSDSEHFEELRHSRGGDVLLDFIARYKTRPAQVNPTVH
jgi:hypothetical protein